MVGWQAAVLVIVVCVIIAYCAFAGKRAGTGAYVTIPTEMSAADTALPAPKILFLTAASRDDVPQYVFDRFAHFAKGYTVKFFDDGSCRESLRAFGRPVVEKFDSLKGAHRADLWRYCMLYLYGGVYADIKTVFTRPLDEVITDRTQNYTVIGWRGPDDPVDHIHQGFIATVPHNPVIMECILHVLSEPVPVVDYHVFVKKFVEILQDTVGDVVVGTVADWTFFQETELHTEEACAQRDHVGFCRLEFLNERGETMAVCRDPDYPWKEA